MSAAAIVAGKIEPREGPVQTVWRLVSGEEYERRWWGLASAVKGMEQSVRDSGATEVTFTQSLGSPIGILTAKYVGRGVGTPNITVETMTINFSDETIPLHQNPSFIGLTNATILDLEEKIKNHDVNPYSDSNTTEWKYYELRSRGMNSYRVKLPKVTWTRTVGIKYNTIIDLENVGGIFSTEDLVDSVGAPILFGIPTGNVGVSEGGLFTPGWLKDASVDFTSDGKVQLVITGEYGLWANDAYVFVA